MIKKYKRQSIKLNNKSLMRHNTFNNLYHKSSYRTKELVYKFLEDKKINSIHNQVNSNQ